MTISASDQISWVKELEALATEQPTPESFAQAVSLRWRELLETRHLALVPLLGPEPTVATAATAATAQERQLDFDAVVATVRQSREAWREREYGDYLARSIFVRRRRVGALVFERARADSPAVDRQLAFLNEACGRLLLRLAGEASDGTASWDGTIAGRSRARPGVDPEAAPFVPQQFGKYVLLDRIAVGGMAEIMLARSAVWGGVERLCVVKRILPNLCHNARFVSRFIDEARVTIDLRHENLVHLIDFGQVDGAYYIAMELVRGTDVAHLARLYARSAQGMPAVAAAYIGASICRALAFAHDRRGPDNKRMGIVHRDVTPHNVLIDISGQVKLADFGIAKARHQLTEDEPGTVVGKFSYMSPEQTQGEPLDALTDIWAVGVILHELLTVRRLFRAENTQQTIDAVCQQPILAPSVINPEVPEVLDNIVMGALERDRHLRTSSAATLARALEDFVDDQGYGPEAFLDEIDRVGWQPLTALQAWDDQTEVGQGFAPRLVRAPHPVLSDEVVIDLLGQLRAQPDLWLLVELGDRFLTLGHADWGLAAVRIAAALFAYQGLYIQTACVAHLARPKVGDAVVNQDILSLLSLDRDAHTSWLACIRAFDTVGFAELIPEAMLLLEQGGRVDVSGARHALNPLFDLLSPEETAQLFKLAKLHRVPAGRTVVAEGAPGDAMYAVARGRLVVYCGDRACAEFSVQPTDPGEPGDEQEEGKSSTTPGATPEGGNRPRIFLSALSDGDLFGEISFLSHRRRTATVEAITDSLVLRFGHERTHEFFSSNQGLLDMLRDSYRTRMGTLLLARNPIFATLPLQANDEILLHAARIEASTDEVIVREGDTGTDLFLIVEGEAEVCRQVDGVEAFINKLGPGDFFGERAALTGEARTATVRAMGDLEMLRITSDQVLRFLHTQPQARSLMEAAIEVRRVEGESRIEEMQRALAGL